MSAGELLTLMGFLTGGAVLWWEARRRGLNTEGMRLVAVLGVFGGVVGAKLTEWMVSGQWWNLPTAFLEPRVGGKALMGGLAAGWATVWLVKRKLGIRRSTGDMWALAIPAGEAVGRLGCYLNGCCYGVPCAEQFPLAVWQHGAWRQPAQLYSSLAAAVLFLVLWRFDRWSGREGETWKLFLLLWTGTRFGLEFARERPLMVGSFSMMQVVCLETVGMVLVGYWWGRRKNRVMEMRSVG